MFLKESGMAVSFSESVMVGAKCRKVYAFEKEIPVDAIQGPRGPWMRRETAHEEALANATARDAMLTATFRSGVHLSPTSVGQKVAAT